jgi:dipeptidase
VVGNVNEYGLCIGESTFGGLELLAKQTGAIVDYGSLIWITLQRAKTAREAISTMVELMDEYGYASEGESFSIADHSGEVWIMEVIGRGNTGRLGAVWVARRIPDGYVTSHANQARITTFPRDDPENCLYADDVVDLAIQTGLFPADADEKDFSFSDVYAPVSFGTARLSEARVWSIFSRIADEDGSFEMEYLDYAAGRTIAHRMPLWIKPYKKLSLRDLMTIMSNHYENSELDASADVGAGFYGDPYRPRPLIWNYNDKTYHNERTVATQQTGWNFIAQMRHWMPQELSALVWFAVDDSSMSPRVPVYGSSTRVSTPYAGKGSQDGVVEPVLKFDLKKAFWIQNMVANFVYPRFSEIYPIVRLKIDLIQENFINEVASVDKKAIELYERDGPGEAVAWVTKYGEDAGETLHAQWLEFYGYLFARFRDFFDIVPNENNPGCGCDVREPGIPDEWKKRIVDETGTHYEVKNSVAIEKMATNVNLRESR